MEGYLKLIKENQYNYNEFAKVFNITVSESVKYFKELNIKTCNRKINCKYSNGPVQPRENFKNENSSDGKQGRCRTCAKEEEKYYIEIRNKYNNSSNKNEFLRNLILTNNYTYKTVKNILYISMKETIELFENLDLKKCSSNQKCLNIDGPVQSRENFKVDKTRSDGLCSLCIYCQKENRKQYNNLNKDERKKKDREINKLPVYYDAYSRKLESANEVRQDLRNKEILQVKCISCKNWFTPTKSQVQNRIQALEGNRTSGTENHFYCSDKCKNSCSIFHKQWKINDLNNHYDRREVQPELRELVLERDNYTCVKCGNINKLQCHHIEGIQWEPIESADIDKCITVCEECHQKIHQIPGCTYNEMSCNV